MIRWSNSRGQRKLPPFWIEGADPRFWLGTDAVGRDMLSRLMYGARISLVHRPLGDARVDGGRRRCLGLAAAWFGGLVDVIIIRIMDLIMAIPSLVLAILIIAIIGPSASPTPSSPSPSSTCRAMCGWCAPRPLPNCPRTM